MGLDGLVNEGVFVASFSAKPVDNSGDNLSNVLFRELEVGVVRNAASLIKVGSVNEVPFVLPRTTVGLDFVSKGCRLNEWIAVF